MTQESSFSDVLHVFQSLVNRCTNVNETDRTRSLWPGKKRSFFLVFRKLTYSPNMWRRFVVELSKAKEPSTTDSFIFVSKYNVRLNFLFFWRSFVSQSFGYLFKMERSWVRVTLFPCIFCGVSLSRTQKTHENTQVLRLGGKKGVFVFFSKFLSRDKERVLFVSFTNTQKRSNSLYIVFSH